MTVAVPGQTPGARAPATAATVSTELGTTWRWATSSERLPEHLLEQPLAARQAQIGELLRAEHEADAGRPRPGEQPHDLLGRDRGELVDHDERADGTLLQSGDHGVEVLHDRGAEHLPTSGRVSETSEK